MTGLFNMQKLIYIAGLLFVLVACSQREAKEQTEALPEIFPDYVGVTVPENICPMNFSVPECEHVHAIVENDRGEVLDVSGSDHVELPVNRWHELLKGAQEVKMTVSAWNEEHPDGVIFKPFTIKLRRAIYSS